jgi:peptidoglycan/xylan/chitin deacetylase (PgdA/CDA1 family)
MSRLSDAIVGERGSQPGNRPARRVPILSYHAIVGDDCAPLPPESSAFHAVSSRSFREHLDILTSDGWNVVPSAALRQPSVPPRSLVITFDDGHASDVFAARELRRCGLPATFFITWLRLGCAGFLNRSQIRELGGGGGFTIGSHGMTHVPLAELAPREAHHQLTGSKERIEELLGEPVTDLAVPFGSYNRQVIDHAIAAGYRSMMTSDFSVAVAGNYLLPRLTVHSQTTLKEFKSLLAGSFLGITRQRLANGLAERIKRLRSILDHTDRLNRTMDPPSDPLT